MSDFFEGLAARSSGAATALRPRLASAYETRDALEIIEEAPAAPNVPLPPPPARAAAPTPPEPQPQPARVPEPPPIREETAPAAREQRTLEQTIERVHHVLSPQAAETRPEERPAPRAAEAPPEPPAESVVEPAAVEPAVEVRERETVRVLTPPPRELLPPPPRVPPVGRRQTIRTIADRQPPASPGEPSTVRITIGRVEVRAVQPPQPPPRPAPPPAPPGPTLEEFLEERERRP